MIKNYNHNAMHNHASPDYICPICLGVSGVESKDTLLRRTDIVYIDESVTAFINSFWIKNNPGHVIVVPNDHYENLYDLPSDLGSHIFPRYENDDLHKNMHDKQLADPAHRQVFADKLRLSLQ